MEPDRVTRSVSRLRGGKKKNTLWEAPAFDTFVPCL